LSTVAIQTPAVSEIMTKNVIHSVRPGDSIKKAAQRMKEVQSGCLVVIDRGRLVGIVTERDIVQRVVAEGRSFNKTLVSRVMSSPVITASPRTSVSDGAKLMLKNGIRRLPITQGKHVVGMLTVTDLAKYLSKSSNDPLLAATSRAEYQTIFE
jgi:CBS domain-containing protein